MADFHTLGREGEEAAVRLLQQKGYEILERNWKSGRREIDIIAGNERFIVFVEVKTRMTGFLVHPLEAVGAMKQRNMIFAAEAYVKRYPTVREIRFDIISVVAGEGGLRAEHVEDAFYPTL